jgi:hypothetical protein
VGQFCHLRLAKGYRAREVYVVEVDPAPTPTVPAGIEGADDEEL